MPRKKKTEEVTEEVEATGPNPKVLQAAVAAVEKKYGAGVVGAASTFNLKEITVIPSSSIALNLKTGRGGLVRGRIAEIYGPPGSGKTSLMLDYVSSAQRIARQTNSGEKVVWCDAEMQFDEEFASSFGVDPEDLIIVRNDDGESNLDAVETLMRSGMVSLAVIDSVAALAPRKELEKAIDEDSMMLHPKLMSLILRRWTSIATKNRTLVGFINQIRSTPSQYNPDVTPGGHALRYYSSYRLEVWGGTSSTRLKEGKVVYGHTSTIKTVKNRLAPPFQECSLDLIYGAGFDTRGELIKIAESLGILEKSGTHYSFKEEKLGQGRDNVKLTLMNNQELESEIRKCVMDTIEGTDELLV